MNQIKMKCLNILVLIMLKMVSTMFSEGEFKIIMSLARFFNAGSIVFVDEKSSSAQVAEYVAKASESNVASLVVAEEELNDELSRSNERSRKTIITTKRKFYLGPYLQKMEIPKNIVWALFSEPLDIDSIAFYISFSGEVLYIRDDIDNMTVYELLHPYKGKLLFRRTFGFLRNGKTIDFPTQTQHALNKLNLGGLEIKVGVPDNICEKREGNVLIGNIFCYHRKILNIIAKKMNIRQKRVSYSGGNHSFVYPNGSYAGYFKMLMDGEADIAVASFVATSKRMDHFDFIWPTFAQEILMYVKKSEAVGFSSANTPFSKYIWIITFFWMILIGILLYVTNHYSRESNADQVGALQAVFTSILKIMQLTCNQGSSSAPDFLAGKVLFFTTLIGGMLLEYYYSATVQSYLTIEKFQLPFNNVEEFIENGRYKAIGLSDGFSMYFLKFESPLKHNMKPQYFLKDKELPTTVEKGITMLCQKNYLTLIEMRGTILNARNFDCELVEIPHPIFFQFFGLGTAKGHQLKDSFKPVLWRLNELGIIKRMSNKLSKFSDVPEFRKKSDYQAVTLENITNIFIVFKTGALISSLILLLEILYIGRKKNGFRNKHFGSERKQFAWKKGLQQPQKIVMTQVG